MTKALEPLVVKITDSGNPLSKIYSAKVFLHRRKKYASECLSSDFEKAVNGAISAANIQTHQTEPYFRRKNKLGRQVDLRLVVKVDHSVSHSDLIKSEFYDYLSW